jgi:hypothetical protein
MSSSLILEPVMYKQHLEYQGYRILAKPSCDSGGRWYGGYKITKGGVTICTRDKLFPGFLYSEAAYTDSIEHAKLEVDNRLAEEKA